ncbi:MAG TPA: hypothetical protein VGC66_24535 [Pyrinomonadaceae bacterium]|jgi:hypothetical protein
MKQPSLCIIIAALASLLSMGSEVLAQGDVPRFEIGGQFSLLILNKPSSQDDEFVSGRVADPGFGARFTHNVTNNIALEAEGNFFPGRDFDSEGSFVTRLDNDDVGVPRGRIYQGQFGVKAGKRFKKVGLFIKIRPGFVGFTKVSRLVGLTPITIIHPFIGPLQFENPEFRIGKATYPSMDVGGVVEFYPSRRIVTRLDIGDTIIRYGISQEPAPVVCATICPPPEVFERPAETRHNLQFSAGIGIRF